jgi:putative DNA primase/helicase
MTAENKKNPLEFLSDLGNAYRLEKYFGEHLRYVTDYHSWIVWNKGRGIWEVSNGGAQRFAVKTVLKLHEEGADATKTMEQRAAIAKWAAQCESTGRMKAMLEMAQASPNLEVDHSVLDQDLWLLNVRNGVVDLHTGELLEAHPRFMMTKQANVEYDETAECTTWLKFLHEAMSGDTERVDYLQKLCGMMLTGDKRQEHLFHILFGEGGNGKSVFYETLLYLLGDYGLTMPVEVLLHRPSGGGPSPEVVKMMGRRLVVTKEPDQGRRLGMSAIKFLCSSDMVAARALYQDQVEFPVTWCLLMSTNSELQIWEKDDGTWDRIRQIPWDVKFRNTPLEDKGLPDKLRDKGELSGILRWMVEGCIKWQQEGLQVPAAVKKSTAEYKGENDQMRSWLEEHCEFGEDFKTRTSELLEHYQRHTRDKHHTANKFGRELQKYGEDFGFEKVQTTGPSTFKGLKPRSQSVVINGQKVA